MLVVIRSRLEAFRQQGLRDRVSIGIADFEDRPGTARACRLLSIDPVRPGAQGCARSHRAEGARLTHVLVAFGRSPSARGF